MQLYYCLALILVVAGCSTTTPDDSPVAPAVTLEYVPDNKPRGGERLLAEPPAQFSLVYQFNNGDTRMAEFVPPGDTGSDWNTKIFFESHDQLVDVDPLEVLMTEVSRLKDACTFVNHYNLFSGLENEYPTSVRMILCGKNTLIDKGELSLAKVIQGDDYLYVIRVVRKLPPFEDQNANIAPGEVATWSNYLSHIKLCNADDPAHPCPDTESH